MPPGTTTMGVSVPLVATAITKVMFLVLLGIVWDTDGDVWVVKVGNTSGVYMKPV